MRTDVGNGHQMTPFNVLSSSIPADLSLSAGTTTRKTTMGCCLKMTSVRTLTLMVMVMSLCINTDIHDTDTECFEIVLSNSLFDVTNLAKNYPRGRNNFTINISPEQNLLENVAQPYYKIVKGVVYNPALEYFTLRNSRVDTNPRYLPVLGSTTYEGGSTAGMRGVPRKGDITKTRVMRNTRTTWLLNLYRSSRQRNVKTCLVLFFVHLRLTSGELNRLINSSVTHRYFLMWIFKNIYKNTSFDIILKLVLPFSLSAKVFVRIDIHISVHIDLLWRYIQILRYLTHGSFVFGHYFTYLKIPTRLSYVPLQTYLCNIKINNETNA